MLRNWRAHLLNPLLGALRTQPPCTRKLLEHAADFPGARLAAERASRKAAQVGFSVDVQWQYRHMMCAALDRQDNFARLIGRSLVSSDRLEVRGEWPTRPFVALGLHWGTGFPALEHLLQAGLQPAFVYRPEQAADLSSGAERLYDRLHLRALDGFGHCIRVGGAYRGIQSALAAGRVPVVLIDAPPQPQSSVCSLTANAWTMRFRSGLMQLLASEAIPFVMFRCWHPPTSATRRLDILTPQQLSMMSDIGQCWADFLLESLSIDGAQWQLWDEADSLIQLNNGLGMTSRDRDITP